MFEELMNCVETGHNVIITGQAGVGKTRLLLEIRKSFQEVEKVVASTAASGIAATQLKGQTIHRWSGIKVSIFFPSH